MNSADWAFLAVVVAVAGAAFIYDRGYRLGVKTTEERWSSAAERYENWRDERERQGDVASYDHATAVHAKEPEQEYRRTLWAAAAALWPKPLNVAMVHRDLYQPSCELQTRRNPMTNDLLVYAVPVGAEKGKLQAFLNEIETISCWQFTWREWLRVLWSGRLWLRQMNFGAALQPQAPSVESPFGAEKGTQ